MENYDTSLRDIRKDKYRPHSWNERSDAISVYVTGAYLIFKQNYKKPRMAKTVEGLVSADLGLL